MIDLKCKCVDCRHNKYSNCTANKINVDNSTICKSFVAKRASNVEFADEILQPLVRKSTDIDCNAPCMFCREGICIANGITVGDLTNNATCETFLPK